MAERMTQAEKSLFDFGPLAREYDRWYERPAGQAHDRAQKEDVRRLLRPGRVGERLLDAGCGTGHWSSFFAGMGYRVTGIDIAPEMINLARAAAAECSFRIGDLCELPFEDASFDVAAPGATLCSSRASTMLFCFGDSRSAWKPVNLPGGPYACEIIATWKMTIRKLKGAFAGKFDLPLPGKPFTAARFIWAENKKTIGPCSDGGNGRAWGVPEIGHLRGKIRMIPL